MNDTPPAPSSAWFVEDGQLRLRLPSGRRITPTASEVVGAQFKDRMAIRGEVVGEGPSCCLPEIEFSRFPLSALLQVSPPASDLSEPPACRIILLDGRKALELEAPSDTDHVLVSGAHWYPLPTGILEEIHALLQHAGIAPGGRLTLRQYADLRRLRSDLIVFTEPPDPARRPAGDQSTAPVPPTLNATFYPYQQTGYAWLCRIADEGLGCILGDEMGLGKTLQVIALLLREQQRAAPSLVIAPATLLENWRREVRRFAPTLSVCIHRGQTRTGFPKALRSFDVVVTSYETAMRDSSLLSMLPWNIMVLDEAQAIKTPAAQRTVAIKALPRRVGIAVSGTPVENRLRDLWSLMDYAVPGVLGSLEQFERDHEDSVNAAAALEPIVTPLILRRKVADVATDLPPRIDIPQPVELDQTAAAHYDDLRREIEAQYGASASLVALTKLRMFCTHPFLADHATGDPLPVSTKYARLTEILEEIFTRREKALIFTSYTEMADILATDLPRRFGVVCRVIDGRTEVTDRQPTVDRFGEMTEPGVLILNPRAAGTGLNITAANHVIHYNPEWNPALEDQATARAYRRGQSRPVTVHRLFHPGTVEEIIDQRLRRKRALAATAVVGTEGEQSEIADVLAALRLTPRGGETA